MYNDRLIDHFRNPRFVGDLESPAITVEVMNPACGDVMRLSVLFEGEIAREVRYRTRGCTASIASGSALCEWIYGKTRSELARIDTDVVESAVGGLSPESRHAAALCCDAVHSLLRQNPRISRVVR